MRRVTREPLPADVAHYLERRQQKADVERVAGTLNVETTWKGARQTKKLGSVKERLKQMAGGRARCMYCSDSAGTDIEHFWPKSVYPERMFLWLNMLLCCTGCGRDCKGSQFPMEKGQPALLDPSAEDFWLFLDFSPSTGILFARMDRQGRTTVKGEETVRVFRFAKRDEVTLGYQRSYRRVCKVLRAACSELLPDSATLTHELQDADEHGILGWCFRGNGVNEAPMAELRQRHPAAWAACAQAFQTL